MKRMLFFMQQHGKQLKKKWAALLLLFLFPVLLIGLSAGMLATFFIQDDEFMIQAALIDEDQTKESKLFTNLLEQTANGEHGIRLSSMSRQEAELRMARDEVSAYFTFSSGFTKDLYKGNSITLPITGNPRMPIESQVINEMVSSMARLLAAAQANILTVDEYARQTPMSDDERYDEMLTQFMDFTFFTIGKNKLLKEETLMNIATSSPVGYYLLSGWFIIFTVWLFGLYLLLGKEEPRTMATRLSLFGVTLVQRMAARVAVAVISGILLGTLLFFPVNYWIATDLYAIDYMRFALFAGLYAFITVVAAAIIDVWAADKKVSLIIQTVVIAVALLTSGSLIPVLYFPESMQSMLPYSFSHVSLQWMIDIVLDERNYANYVKLGWMAVAAAVLLTLSCAFKERWRT